MENQILFEKLISHCGHVIEAVTYGRDGVFPDSAAIECITCGEVIIDADSAEREGERS